MAGVFANDSFNIKTMFQTAVTLSTTYQRLSDLVTVAPSSILSDEGGYLYNRDTSIVVTIASGDTIPTGLDGITLQPRGAVRLADGANMSKIWVKSASGTPVLEVAEGAEPPVVPIAVTALGAATGTSLAVSGALTSSSASAGIGYATGAGGTVTQATSKATGVTLSKVTGNIVTHAADLATLTRVSFTLTNTAIAAGDVVNVCIKSGATTGGTYLVQADAIGAGSCQISITNLSAGTLGEALVINFVVIKGVAA